MTTTWKPKKFSDAKVQSGVDAIKAEQPKLWEDFIKYQRLDEGYRDNDAYKALHSELASAVKHAIGDGLLTADLNQLMFQIRVFARREAGLSD